MSVQSSSAVDSTKLARLAQLCREPEIVALAEALGAEAELHLVGGTVRDTLLGISQCDLDLASKFNPTELVARLERAGMRVVPTGLRHQTVTVLPFPESQPIEITTFRGPHMSPEGGVSQGSSIEEDLQFRDFTINALAYSLGAQKILDPHGGIGDLSAGVIRAVGDPRERFAEDPLRVLRMIRLACEKGFALDEATSDAAAALGPALAKVSIERIRDEFSKILVSPRPAEGLRLLSRLSLLEHFFPELAVCVGFEQNAFHPYDVFEHTLEVVSKTEPDLILRLSALFHDIGKPPTLSVDDAGDRHFYKHEQVGAEMTQEILERFRYSNDIIKSVTTLVETHMRPISAGTPGIRRLLRDTGELFPLWHKLKVADATSVRMNQEEFRKELEQFDANVEQVRKGPDVSPLKNLAIGGKDLIELGLTPSPRFGELLRALHERVLDNPELNEKDTLLGLVREMLEDEPH